MPKGKKFDAAEKHFLKKQEVYEKEIKALKARISELNNTVSGLNDQVVVLTAENRQLRAENEKLLEYSKLTPADIRAACEKDKKTAEAATMVSALFKTSGFGTYS